MTRKPNGRGAGFNPLEALNALVLAHEKIGVNGFVVGVVLIQHADGAGECYPSIPRLVRLTRRSKNTVRAGIRELEETGWLHVDRTDGGNQKDVNWYRITVPGQYLTRSARERVQRLTGSAPDRTGSTTDPRRGQPLTPNQPYEPTSNQPDGVELPADLDVDEFKRTWREWLAYRRENRWPCKSRWAERQLAMLAAHGPDVATAALKQSMTMGWQGVFPDKAVTRAPRRAGPEDSDLTPADYSYLDAAR